jgi:hypothetical protein
MVGLVLAIRALNQLPLITGCGDTISLLYTSGCLGDLVTTRIKPMRCPVAFGLAAALMFSPITAKADDPFASLDNLCGAALTNKDCLNMFGEFPEAIGGAIGILETFKSSMSGSTDCKNKLLVGTPPLSDALKYLNVPGIPGGTVPKIAQCSCDIVYSTASCSGEAQKALDTAENTIGNALSTLDSWFGLNTPSAPPEESHDQQKERYYKKIYSPMLDPMTFAPSEVFQTTTRQLTQQCTDDWYSVLWVSDTNSEICGPFYKRFVAELQPRWDAITAAQKAAAQAKADELQKAQDKITDNARKIAMSWAKIKHDVYSKQCHDVQCINDVTVLAFVYYGALASGMQSPNSSNTQVLSQTNAKFEPMFKQKVAEAENRVLVKQTDAKRKVATLLAPGAALLARTAKIKADLYAKLRLAGIKNPEQVLLRARYLRVRKIAFIRPSGNMAPADARPVQR